MSKRGAIDQYFTRLAPANSKKQKPDALDCKAVGGQDQAPDQPSKAPWDELLVSPRGLNSSKQPKQQQHAADTGSTPPAETQAAAGDAAAAAAASGAAAAAPARGSSEGGSAESSAAAAAGAAAAPNALGALMAAARGRGGKAAGTGGGSKQEELSVQDMVARANSNQAAAAAAVRTAAAAGQPPQLRSLLVEPSWLQVLGPEFDKPYMQQLSAFLQQEWRAGTVYPPQASLFAAFNTVPFDQVRVVILGQDPYINAGEAMGLAFSVPRGVRVPPSLANIYKELAADVGAKVPQHGCLDQWCHQGVLLLNAALTVRAKQSNSHAGKGWEDLTSAALTALAKQRTGIVFLLWGKFAQERCAKLDMRRHHVLKSVHPSPLSAHRGFLGCRHFSATNRLLVQGGHRPIQWQIEDGA